MERLSGLDAGFLYMETPTLHMHTLKIGIIDPSTATKGYDFDRFRQVLAGRLHLLPPFRRSLVNVPFGLHHPLWREDPDFDLDYHLRRVGVPQPGTQRELNELIGDIASRPLDRSRPLWQMWVVDGLDDGGVAFVTKMHHSVADGAAASAMLANIMSPDPDAADDVDTPPWRGQRRPPRWYLLLEGVIAQLVALRALPSLILRTFRSVRELVGGVVDPATKPPRPILDAPMASFNGSLTPHRTFGTAKLPLDDMKAIKNAFGVSLNDVVLAVVGGALRGYMEDRGERHSKPLVAGIPVGTDAPGEEPRLIGNRVSNLFTPLATDLEDPVERLQRIHVVTASAKRVQATLGMDMMSSWVEYTPAPLLRMFMRLYSRWRLADRHAPPINLVVSNVPGPPVPLYIDGARLTALYSVGPILEGAGLNVTVWSYDGCLYFAVLACRERVPDAQDLADRFEVALSELTAAVRAAAAG